MEKTFLVCNFLANNSYKVSYSLCYLHNYWTALQEMSFEMYLSDFDSLVAKSLSFPYLNSRPPALSSLNDSLYSDFNFLSKAPPFLTTFFLFFCFVFCCDFPISLC